MDDALFERIKNEEIDVQVTGNPVDGDTYAIYKPKYDKDTGERLEDDVEGLSLQSLYDSRDELQKGLDKVNEQIAHFESITPKAILKTRVETIEEPVVIKVK